MGCASYQRLASEHERLSKRLSKVYLEKQAAYEDKIQLETEVSQLKQSMYSAVDQAERMRRELNSTRSTEFPEIFESAYDVEVIGDWLEMDLRDGDLLLEALKAIYPPAKNEILKLQSHCLKLRTSDSTLRDYLSYFRKRFDLFASSWREISTDQKQVESITQQLKSDLAAAIQRVEGFLGKRSDALNELHAEFRRVCSSQTTEFLQGQRTLQKKLAGLVTEMHAKKLEEKDVERKRVINLLENEISKLSTKKQSEASFYDLEAAESTYRDRLNMLAEDYLAATSRHIAEKELIQSVLTEEINQQITENKDLHDLHKHEKAIQSIKHSEETASLRKESEKLARELGQVRASHAKEVASLREIAKKEARQARERHDKELKERDDVLTALKEDFMRKIDSQKATLEDKLNAEKEKYAKNEQILRAEIAEKEKIVGENRSSDLLSYKLITGLVCKLAIATADASLAERDAEANVREAVAALQSLSAAGEADLQGGLYGNCWKALCSDAHSSQTDGGEVDTLQKDLAECRLRLAEMIQKYGQETSMLRAKIDELRLFQRSQQEVLDRKDAELLSLRTVAEAWKGSSPGDTAAPSHNRTRTDLQPLSPRFRTYEQSQVFRALLMDLTQKEAPIPSFFPTEARQKAIRRALKRLNRCREDTERTAVRRWREKTARTPRSRPPCTVSSFSLSSISPRADQRLSEVERILQDEHSAQTANWEGLLRALSRCEVPLRTHETFQLFEELLDAKSAHDEEYISSSQLPLPMPRFAAQHLSAAAGSKSSGKRRLMQALICLLTHIREGQKYAEVICRLLQFGVEEKATQELSVFIVRARGELKLMVESVYAEAPEVRRTVGLMGGELRLRDAVRYVYRTFASDRKAGQSVLKLIRPSDLSLPAYVFLIIRLQTEHYAGRIDELWTRIAGKGRESMPLSDFLDALPKSVEIWLDDRDIAAAVSANSDAISCADFAAGLRESNSEVLITVADVLKALMDTAKTSEKETAEELLACCGAEGPLSFIEFTEIVARIDAGVAVERVKAIWETAEEISTLDIVSTSCVVRALLRHRIGKYAQSPFCEFHSDDSRLDPTLRPLIPDIKTSSSSLFPGQLSSFHKRYHSSNLPDTQLSEK